MADNNENSTEKTPENIAAIINDPEKLANLTPFEMNQFYAQAKGEELSKLQEYIWNTALDAASGELRYETQQQYKDLRAVLENLNKTADEEKKVINQIIASSEKADGVLKFEAQTHKLNKLLKKKQISVEDIKELIALNDYFREVKDVTAEAKESAQKSAAQAIEQEVQSFVDSPDDWSIDFVETGQQLIDGVQNEELKTKAQEKLDNFVNRFDEENGLSGLKTPEDLHAFEVSMQTAIDYFDTLQPFAVKEGNLPEAPHEIKMAEARAQGYLFHPDGSQKDGYKKWAELSWAELADINQLTMSGDGITKERAAFHDYLWKKVQNMGELGQEDLAAVKAILATPGFQNKGSENSSKSDRKAFAKIQEAVKESSEKLKTPNFEAPEFAESYKVLNALSFTNKGIIGQKDLGEEKNKEIKNLIMAAAQADAAKRFATLTPEEISQFREHMPNGAEFQPYVLNSLLNESITEIAVELVVNQDLARVMGNQKPDAEKLVETLGKMADSNKSYAVSESTVTGILARRASQNHDVAVRFAQLSGKAGYTPANVLATNNKNFDGKAAAVLPGYNNTINAANTLKNLQNSSLGRASQNVAVATLISIEPSTAAFFGAQAVYRNIAPIVKDIRTLKRTGQWPGLKEYVKNNKGLLAERIGGAVLGGATVLTSLTGIGTPLMSAAKMGAAFGMQVFSEVRRNGWSWKGITKVAKNFSAQAALAAITGGVAHEAFANIENVSTELPTEQPVEADVPVEEDVAVKEPVAAANTAAEQVHTETLNNVTENVADNVENIDAPQATSITENDQVIEEIQVSTNEPEPVAENVETIEDAQVSAEPAADENTEVVEDVQAAQEGEGLSGETIVPEAAADLQSEVDGVKYTFTTDKESGNIRINFTDEANHSQDDLTRLNKEVADQAYSVQTGDNVSGPLSEETMAQIKEMYESQESEVAGQDVSLEMGSAPTDTGTGDSSSDSDDGGSVGGEGSEASKMQEGEIKTDKDLAEKQLDNADKDKTTVVQQQVEDRQEVDNEFKRAEEYQKAQEQQAEVNTDEGRNEAKKMKDVQNFVAEEEVEQNIAAAQTTAESRTAVEDAEDELAKIKKESVHGNYIPSDTANVATEAQENAVKVESQANDAVNAQAAEAESAIKSTAAPEQPGMAGAVEAGLAAAADVMATMAAPEEKAQALASKTEQLRAEQQQVSADSKPKEEKKEENKTQEEKNSELSVTQEFNYKGNGKAEYKPDGNFQKAQRAVNYYAKHEKGSLKDYSLEDFAKITKDAFDKEQCSNPKFMQEVLNESMRRAQEFSYDTRGALEENDAKSMETIINTIREQGIVKEGSRENAVLTAAESNLKKKSGRGKLKSSKEVQAMLDEGQKDGKKMSIAELHTASSIANSKKLPGALHKNIKDAYEKTVNSDEFQMPKTEEELKMLEDLNLRYGTEKGMGVIDRLRGVDVKYTQTGQKVSDKITPVRTEAQGEKGKARVAAPDRAVQAAFIRNSGKGMG